MAAEMWRAQNSFAGGVISEKMYGRVELEQYQNSVAELINFKVMPHGGITRRSGTKFAIEVKDSTKYTRLIDFEFSADVGYCLEFGDQYIRFVKNGVQLIDADDDIVELATPYLTAELKELKYVQSADVMWIVHNNHQPYKLIRYSDTEWFLDPVTFIDGPYESVNTSITTMVASAATGSVTLTAAGGTINVTNCEVGTIASRQIKVTFATKVNNLEPGTSVTLSGIVGTTEANGTWGFSTQNCTDYQIQIAKVKLVNAYVSGGVLATPVFATTDVGRHVRIWNDTDSLWAWGTIAAFTSPQIVTVDVIENNFPIVATTLWRLGKWSETTGWPGAVMLYEARLVYAASPNALQQLDFSQTDKFNWFQVAADETLLATDALSWSLYSQAVDDIAWMMPVSGGLASGTNGGCWLVTGAGGKDDPLTPNSVNAKRHAATGVDSNLTPVQIDNAVLFVDKEARRVHEFAYLWQENAFRAPDLNILSDHLFIDTTIEAIAAQGTKKIIWVVAADGRMIGLTYMRAEDVVAWHEHTTDGEFESVCCVTEGRDEIPYVVVKRTINGSTVRYIEYMEKDWDSEDSTLAYYLDCGVQEERPLTPFVTPGDVIVQSGGTATVLYIAATHGLVDGELAILRGVSVDTGSGTVDWDGYIFEVGVIDPTTAYIKDATTGLDIDSTGWTFTLTDATVQVWDTTVSGLDHLEGESVYALWDGKVAKGMTVTGGEITLPGEPTIVSVGLNFNSDMETLPIELANERSGSTVGRIKDIGKTSVRVSKSYGCKMGRSASSLEEVIFNENLMFDATPPLFSGEKHLDKLDGQPDTDVRIYIRQDVPLPLTVTLLNTKLLITED